MKRYRLPLILGLGHGLNDAIAGCLLAAYSDATSSVTAVVFAFLGYSLLAFGGQLPVGWWLDRQQRPDTFLYASLILLMITVVLAPLSLPAAILLSGVVSAFIHVSGGTLCFLHDPRHMTGTGIFTAPGVLGLVLGGLAGHAGWSDLLPFLIPVFLLVFLVLRRIDLPGYQKQDSATDAPLLEAHDFMMLVLLLAIALRSLLWNVFYRIAEERQLGWLLAIGISACAGKWLGGWLADRMHWKRFTFIALGASAALLAFGKESLVLFCAGIFFLQSVVPVTLWVMQQYLRQQPAAATALSLGTAIILAGLPAYLDSYRAIQWDKNLLVTTFVVLLFLNGTWLAATRSGSKPS